MAPDSGALPAEAHVGSVQLDVADLEGMTSFYRDVVGLDRLEASDDRVVLGPGGGPGILVLEASPETPARPEDAAGLFHVAYRVPDRPALADALDRVRAGGHLSGASDHRVSEALYLSDPEDNGVEIYCDRPRDEWPRTEEGGVAMATLPLEFDSLPDGRGEPSVPEGTSVGHVHLEVTAIPDSEAFYRALGMGVQARYGDQAAFLAAGDYHHHLGLNTWNHRTAPTTGRGLAWFQVVVPDGEAVDEAVDRLEDHGATVEATETGARVEDPDGIGLHLKEENTS